MNRRQLLKAIALLPAAMQSIQLARLNPDDVIVIECDHSLSERTADNIRISMKAIWPKHRVAVLGNGLRMKVVRHDA